MVYAATRGKKAFTVVDDKESSQQFDAIWMPPTRQLLFSSRTKFFYLAEKEGSLYRIEEELD